VQALWNIARDPQKNPDGWPLTDFVLAIGDSPWRTVTGSTAVKQSVETMEFLIDSWIGGSNEVFKAKEARQCPTPSPSS
jgi:hypothetical protein